MGKGSQSENQEEDKKEVRKKDSRSLRYRDQKEGRHRLHLNLSGVDWWRSLKLKEYIGEEW